MRRTRRSLSKSIFEMQKFYRNTFFVLSEAPGGNDRFFKTFKNLIASLKDRLYDVKVPVETLQAQRREQMIRDSGENPQSIANRNISYFTPNLLSMKNIIHFNNLYLWSVNQFWEVVGNHAQELQNIILNVFEAFVADLLGQVKQLPLYIELLDAYKILINFMIFLLKRVPRIAQLMQDNFVEHFPTIFGLMMNILKNLPQTGTLAIRKDILNNVKITLSEISAIEKPDMQAFKQGIRVPRVDKGFYQRKNQCLYGFEHEIMQGHILAGRGKINKDLLIVSRQVQQMFFNNMKDHLSIPQLRTAMKVFQRTLLDSTISLAIRGQVIINMFKIYEDYKKKNIDTLPELCDIFEFFSLLFKDLDKNYKFLVEEFALIKSEFTNIKKSSRIRWLNDVEQKGADIRELLLADSAASFVDLSRDRNKVVGGGDNTEPVDISRLEREYHFHFSHEYYSEPTQSDVTRQKENKYNWTQQFDEKQLSDNIENFKEGSVYRFFKNLVSFVETILNALIEKQTAMSPILAFREMKSLKKILIYGSSIIQHYSDMIVLSSSPSNPGAVSFTSVTERDKLFELIKKFSKIFQQLLPLQYRDLMTSAEEKFLGRVMEVKSTKGDVGIVLLADQMMTFLPPPQQVNALTSVLVRQDDYPSYLLEIFFGYLIKKMKIFNKPIEEEKILTQNKMDQRLAKIPTTDLQDAIQRIALVIGEKALAKKNDQRMKNLFFSVFIFCIKFTKASRIVPYYFQVIRNLFKLLSSLNDNAQFVKEFVPMIQGLLETFLQAKEEAVFIKETNEICYSVPAKLKSLIEYLPITSRPLIDSMKLNQFEVIESGITTIQMWVSALTSYPEILDPIIENILPELNSLLYKVFCVLPNPTFKLLGKLGAKTRLYFEDKEFRAKNFPEEGLKIGLEDKTTGREVVLPLDSAIGTILIKVFDCFQKYCQDKLIYAYRLVKNSFLCYIEPDHDVDFLVLSIINAKTKTTDHLVQYAKNSTRYFNSRRNQSRLSNMSRGSETHGFEKILKSLLIASSIPKDNPETAIVHSKIKKFFKWVTQYFTLIYICKNGKLKEILPNEVSPLTFFDNICEFLYFNVLQNSPKQQRSYLKGSIRGVKIMIRTVKEIYGPDEASISEAFESLDFIQVLIQKLCHIAYGQDLPNKVAMNIALQILIKELPVSTIKNNQGSFLDALFHVLNISHEQLVNQVEQESKKTLNMFLEKVGTYNPGLFSHERNDNEFQTIILDKLLSQFYQNKTPARSIAMNFVEVIAKKSGTNVANLLSLVMRPMRSSQVQGDQAQQSQQQQAQSWSAYLVQSYIEVKSKTIFQMYKGGYIQVLNLISYLDVFQYFLKHGIIKPEQKVHTYLVICEQLLKVLEEEVQKYDQQNEQQGFQFNDQNLSLASKSATKYMKLEKQYISQNKVYDPYSHTLHPHHFMQNQHFEVEELAKRDKLMQDMESVQFSYNTYEMFNQPRGQPGQPAPAGGPEVNPKFIENLSEKDLDTSMKQLNNKIYEFIKKMFNPSIKASDISYDYIHHMYELYPNHRLHAELITKCLSVLCDVATEDGMHLYFKQRQQIYFDQMQSLQMLQNQAQEAFLTKVDPNLVNAPPVQRQAMIQHTMSMLSSEQQEQLEQHINSVSIFNGTTIQISPFVCKKQDLYSIEIKSKIIAMFFKFFQREEHIVFKMAKKCLSRILKKEVNQQEALPNMLLKECVRPSLNIISLRTSTPALYEQLTRLICVLHGCFNEQLGKHLIKSYEGSKPKFHEDFVLTMYKIKEKMNSDHLSQANPLISSTPGESTDQSARPPMPPVINPIDQMSELERQKNFTEDCERLISQQNQRIEEIENAYHITKILYLLLPQNRQDIQKILLNVPEFETQILVDLERKFKETYKSLIDFYRIPINLPINVESTLRPLAIKVGQLRSDLREGILKFYNKNPYDAIDMLKSQQATKNYISEEVKVKQGGMILYDIILDILKDPASYCLRERFAREPDLIKHYLTQDIDSQEFYFGLSVIEILQNFNPHILILPHFSIVLYTIRPLWTQKFADLEISHVQNIAAVRRAFNKIMKVFLTYCRHPKAKMNAIIEMLKGYRNQHPLVDMTPVRLFFIFEIPYKFSIERARELVLNVLDRYRAETYQPSQNPPYGMNQYETIYQLFDMIIMPILTRYTDSDTMIRQLFDEKLLMEFMDAMFALIPQQGGRFGPPRVEEMKKNLDFSLYYSSEQFLTEVAKVLNLVFRYFEFGTILAATPNRDILRLNWIMYNWSKKSKTPLLIEWSFYSLTSMYIRILNTIQLDNSNEVIYSTMEQCSTELLILLLQHHQNVTVKALVHKTFRNLIQIIENINQQRQFKEAIDKGENPAQIQQNQNQSQRYEAVAIYLKQAMKSEGRQTQAMAYLCSFVLGHSDVIYHFDYQFKFISRINKVVLKLAANNTPNVQAKQLVAELSHVMISWARQRYVEFNRNMTSRYLQEILNAYFQIAHGLFFNLTRLAINIHSIYEPLRDQLDLVQLYLKQIKNLVQLFTKVKIQFPLFQRMITDTNIQTGAPEQESIQLIRLIMLNIFYILNRYSQQRPETVIFFMEYLLPVTTRLPKLILFSARMVYEILYSGVPENEARRVNQGVKMSIEEDVRRCHERPPEELSRIINSVKTIEDRYIAERKPPILCFQEQAMAISQIIPHFAIRLLDFLEREQARTGVNVRRVRGCVAVENEFKFYKDLCAVLYKVISNFRKQLIFDQGEAAPAKLKVKHSILHMTNTHTTQYTPPELIQINDDIIEIRVDDTNFDMFNKESVILGLLLIVKKMKKLKNEESVTMLEHFQSCFQYLLKYNLNEYILEGIRKIVDVVIIDEADDVTKFLPEKKAEYVRLMLAKAVELHQNNSNLPKDQQNQNTKFIEKIFEQGIRFLESQDSLMHEYTLRLFEKLFIHSKGKPVELKHRLYAVFEKTQGTSLFKKLSFFFSKHVIEENDKLDKLCYYAAQSQFLDFTLYGFRTSTNRLRKVDGSSRLFSMSKKSHGIVIENEAENQQQDDQNDEVMLPLGEDAEMNENDEYKKIAGALQGFSETYGRFKEKKMSSLVNCLSEIIGMNPTYSQDKMIADKLLSFVFCQYWSNFLTREEQQTLTDPINRFLMQSITAIGGPSNSALAPVPGQNAQPANDFKRYSFPRLLLEALATISPQIRLEPEMLQLMGKTFNLWHVVLPILENHAVLFPDNERYFFSVNELYEKLGEHDYIAGLRRLITKSPETRTMISYAQHDMWEDINQQFSHFLIYYAEQEGQYAKMDEDQGKIGKYQRQIPETQYQQMMAAHEQYNKAKYDGAPAGTIVDMTQEQFVSIKMNELNLEIDRISGRRKFEADRATYDYPRRGPNNLVKEVDLRQWESLFSESLKVLNKWEQYHDIARALSFNLDVNNVEMLIEYNWNMKKWEELKLFENILKRSDNLKHRLYHIYLCIKNQNFAVFDDAFKTVVLMAFTKWDSILPKYIDNTVHFDNLILYQLIMEGSEGGRNMVKEAQSARNRARLVDLKTAVNIWRERVPLHSENIQMWKEVLENRNFIQDQISAIMIPSAQMPPQGIKEEEVKAWTKQQEGFNNLERQRFSNEFLDKSWNYYKLASIARKQHLPELAYHYLKLLEKELKFISDSETMKYEKFKFDYEYMKLQMDFNTNLESQTKTMYEFAKIIENKYILPFRQQNTLVIQPQQIGEIPPQQQPRLMVFETYQIAAMQRLLGDYYLRVGSLDLSQKHLKESLSLNKKEAKTWLTFAKLNQTVFNHKKDEVSLQNIIKSYLSAMTLSLHKSRFIVPDLINLIKKRRDLNQPQFQEVQNALKKNLEQMPTWIWLFWIPQILQMFFSLGNFAFDNIFSRTIIEKICRLYPQAIYYPLKTRHELARFQTQVQPPVNLTAEDSAALQYINNLVGQYNNLIRRHAYQATFNLDRISSELMKTLKSTPEEELQLVLSKILCMSQFFKIDNFERDFKSFLSQLHSRFFNQQNTQQSPLLAELQSIYEADFLMPETRETDIIEIIKRVKNLKDFLHMRINLTEQKTYLELISPFLANYNEKGVELPGQYFISEQEPLPQNTIYIQKFDPNILKGSGVGGTAQRRIIIRCSNQRTYSFSTFNMIQTKEEYNKVFNEERLNQVKLMMNMIFKKHKETLRRGAKFYVSIKALMYRSKLVQDDFQFQTMQEIHDFLFHERGMDTDQALNLQIKKVEEALAEIPATEERSISRISAERKQRINDETFEEMQSTYCKPYLLSSFFHRIFYNVDELFLFKKYFTIYHAVNSFFAYVFTQVDQFTLNQIQVSKTSGLLSFNDAKLIESLKSKNIKKYLNQSQQQSPVDFDAIEQEDCSVGGYLPFRLSNNFVDFIGRSGVHGVFAGVMTSCSLAMAKYGDKFMPLLYLIYRDELNDERDTVFYFISQCIEYMKFKMLSLSKNKNVLNLDHYLQDPEYVRQYLEKYSQRAAGHNEEEHTTTFANFKVPSEYLKFEVDKPNVMEEMNKKVFDLIEIATDERRLSQMPSNWNAWF